MKKIKIVLILLLICIGINVYALPKPTNEFYVNDYAGILSNTTEKYIIEKSAYLASKTKAQIVVVTVPNLDGRDIESYATELFREFAIGDKEENNGLLLLLAKNERLFRVEVGYGLEGVLPDGLTGRYQDEYIIPYLKEDKWDEGITNGYNAFYKKIAEYYNISSDDIEEPIDKSLGIEKIFNKYLAYILASFGAIALTIKNVLKGKAGPLQTLLCLAGIVGNIIVLYLIAVINIELAIIIFVIELVFLIFIALIKNNSWWGGDSYGGSSFSSGGSSGGFSGGGGSTRGF